MKSSTNYPMSRKKKIIILVICAGIIIGDFLAIAFFSWAIHRLDNLFEQLLTPRVYETEASTETTERIPAWTSSYEEEKEALDKIVGKKGK